MTFAAVKALLFDLDGTLVDSVPDLAEAVDRMLADFGHPPAGEAKVRLWVGTGSRSLVSRALSDAKGGQADDELIERALANYFDHYEARLCVRSRLYEGVSDTLARLRSEGYPLAIVTNKPERFVRPLLDGLGIAQHFSAMIGGDTLAQRKPHPQPLLHAADALGVEPTQALMIGDSRNDIEAARAARIPVVCVPYGYNHGRDVREYHPDRLIERFGDLLTLLSEAA